MTIATRQFLEQLEKIVGKKHLLSKENETRAYRRGYRFGNGSALAVVRPGSLIEQWRVLQACIAADKIVLMQAANTGLTGGSTPDGNEYDRDVVIISTLRMKKIQLIDQGKQVICFPGATLDQLENALRPLGREPHSVIGSSCIGASVLGGVCNNSGGSLIQRGPAYTQLSLFARVNEQGVIELVNHLGVSLGNAPEEILSRLESGEYTDQDINYSAGHASDKQYIDHVRQVDADSPARFNADASRLYEASGCSGKLMLFAVRLDTFPMAEQTKVCYIGTNDPDELTAIRRHMLANFETLPIAAEYMHRDAYDIAEKYGKDVFLAIQYLGTSRIPLFFALKNRFDGWTEKLGLPVYLGDHLLQKLASLFPSHLPRRMKNFRRKFEHHLLLKISGEGIQEAQDYLSRFFSSSVSGGYFECNPVEGSKAFLHRFAAAGAAIRYRAVHAKKVEGIIALDIALKRNERNWVETLPKEIESKIIVKLYYGHFFCHVFHQDYIVKKGEEYLATEHAMLNLLEQKGAEYPAEHNVGHLYPAKPPLKSFYQQLDPCNYFNPGIGHLSKMKNWR